jgi:hypothetical protein
MNNRCRCLIKHARTDKERQVVWDKLVYFRKISDMRGIALAMGQLSQCPQDKKNKSLTDNSNP